MPPRRRPYGLSLALGRLKRRRKLAAEQVAPPCAIGRPAAPRLRLVWSTDLATDQRMERIHTKAVPPATVEGANGLGS
jgi:hypothetical protein